MLLLLSLSLSLTFSLFLTFTLSITSPLRSLIHKSLVSERQKFDEAILVDCHQICTELRFQSPLSRTHQSVQVTPFNRTVVLTFAR